PQRLAGDRREAFRIEALKAGGALELEILAVMSQRGDAQAGHRAMLIEEGPAEPGGVECWWHERARRAEVCARRCGIPAQRNRGLSTIGQAQVEARVGRQRVGVEEIRERGGMG